LGREREDNSGPNGEKPVQGKHRTGVDSNGPQTEIGSSKKKKKTASTQPRTKKVKNGAGERLSKSSVAKKVEFIPGLPQAKIEEGKTKKGTGKKNNLENCKGPNLK